MANIGELFVKLKADTSDFEKGMNRSQSSMGTFKAVIANNLNQIGQQMTRTGKQMISSIGNIVTTASDWSAEVEQQKFVYNNLDPVVQKAIDKNKGMAESLGMTKQQYMNNTTAVSDFLQRMGMTGTEIANQSGKVTQLTADMAAFANVPVDVATSDFKSALVGNFNALDKYGVSVNVATINQGEYAKSLGKTWDQMTQAEKAQAILSETMSQASSFTGLAQQEAGGFTMQLQLMKQRLMESAAAIGEKLFPVLEPLIAKISEIAQNVANWANEHPKLTQAIMTVIGVIAILMTVGGTLMTVFASISTIMLATRLSFTALALPIAGIIAGIVALVTAGVALWQNWGTIKSVAGSVWNSIKSTISSIVNSIKASVSSAWNGIKSVTSSIFNSVKSVASSVWNSIKSTISSVVNSIKSVVSTAFNAVKSTVTTVWNGIKNAIVNPINAAKSAISNAMSAIKRAVNVSLKPNLKLPHISVSGKLSINPPSVPKIGVQWYAKGGIMTSPTLFGMNGNNAMVGGEAGQEAILPLSGFYKHLDKKLDDNNNNNGVVNELIKLRQLISSLKLVLNVDGREFTRTAIAPNNDEIEKYKTTRNPKYSY